MPAGRPKIYTTVQTLQDDIDYYFETCEDKPTITGLALHLGFKSRQSFYDYAQDENLYYCIMLARKRIDPPSNKSKYDYKTSKRQKGAFSQNERIKERRKLDPSFRVRTNFAALLRFHLKNKSGRTFDILNYTVKDLMEHLERNFNDEMKWDNYGEYWHIDHITPASLFDHSNIDEFKKCWSLTNLQPLSALDNLKKGNKLLVS